MGDEAFALCDEYMDFYVEEEEALKMSYIRKSKEEIRYNKERKQKRIAKRREKRQTSAKERYNNAYTFNKSAKVGETIICPICKNHFVKKQYSQAFCSPKCKNTYWDETKGDRHKK